MLSSRCRSKRIKEFERDANWPCVSGATDTQKQQIWQRFRISFCFVSVYVLSFAVTIFDILHVIINWLFSREGGGAEYSDSCRIFIVRLLGKGAFTALPVSLHMSDIRHNDV